jgi:hypothetical protein
VGDGALWLAGGCVGKRLLGFFVLERMEERDGFFDGGLHLCGAAGGEIHSAELIGRGGGQGVRSENRGLKSEKKEQQP